MQRALFLDRDGTLVEPRQYPFCPKDLVLAGDIGPLLRMFQTSGWDLIVATNQSGIARGYFSEHDLERTHDTLRDKLRVWGVELNAIHFCPHSIERSLPRLITPCRCRTPQPGMLIEAATRHQIDLSRSWMIGDMLDDVEAGNRAGCQTALVDLGTEPCPEHPTRWPRIVARSTADALRQIAFAEDLIPVRTMPPQLRPRKWYSEAAR